MDQICGPIERLSPAPVCDDSIAERLGLRVRQHANHKTRKRVGQGGLERRIDSCSRCGATRKVIQRAAR